jgi:hypothetical protein
MNKTIQTKRNEIVTVVVLHLFDIRNQLYCPSLPSSTTKKRRLHSYNVRRTTAKMTHTQTHEMNRIIAY